MQKVIAFAFESLVSEEVTETEYLCRHQSKEFESLVSKEVTETKIIYSDITYEFESLVSKEVTETTIVTEEEVTLFESLVSKEIENKKKHRSLNNMYPLYWINSKAGIYQNDRCFLVNVKSCVLTN